MRAGADIDAVDCNGDTPLCTAIRHKQGHIFELLLEHGANPNGPTPEIAGPLHVAVQENVPKFVDVLLIRGANHCARDVLSGLTALHEALTTGKYEILDILLRHDADCWDRGWRLGQTFLTDAIAHQDLWSLTALLSLRHDPNCGDEYGQTPLLKAAYLVSDEKFLCLLLAAGAKLNCVDVYNWTALHFAASKLRVGFMEVLIERGIDVLHRNNAGMTALDVAWRVVCDKTIYVNWETGELEKWNLGMGKYVGPYDYAHYTEKDPHGEESYGQEESKFEIEEQEPRKPQQVEEETRATHRGGKEPQIKAKSDHVEKSRRPESERKSWMPEGEPKDHFHEKLRRFRDIERLWEDFVFGRYGQRRNRLLKTSMETKERTFEVHMATLEDASDSEASSDCSN